MDGTGWPGPADVEYFTEAQAGAWGETLRAFLRFAEIPPGARVLDVGAGPGLLPRLCAEAGARLAVACDESLTMARRAAELARGVERFAVVAGHGGRLPVPSGAFDAVMATNLLFLLPDPAAGMQELVRASAAGGVVAILNPSDAMSTAAAEAFAAARGMTGFARFSLVNYARLAEEHHRLGASGWLLLAQDAGLSELRSKGFAGGLEVFVSGTNGAAQGRVK